MAAQRMLAAESRASSGERWCRSMVGRGLTEASVAEGVCAAVRAAPGWRDSASLERI